MTSRRVLVALLVAGGMAPAVLAAPDSLVVFRSGKTMRVTAHREEGDWVYLTVSPRANPKDEPSEIGVRKDSILRFDTPQVAPDPVQHGSAGIAGASANGVVQSMSEIDALAAAESSRPGGPRMDEAREKVMESVPAAGTPEGNLALVQDGVGVPRAGGGGGGGPEWDVDPEKAGAGSVIRAPLRNMKMSKKYIDRARQLHEQREAAKAAAAAAAAAKAEAGGTPPGGTPPPPQSPHP